MEVRKARAGSSSHGHVWGQHGAVLDIPEVDARELVAIPDGGFSIVEPTVGPEPDSDQARTDIDEAPRPARMRGRRRVDAGADEQEIHETG